MKLETGFPIEYYRKSNGGMYTAYNLELKHVRTEYWMCIDSDDWLSDEAVNIIYREIEKCSDLNVSGIVGLDALPNGEILDGKFPDITLASLMDLKLKYRHKGDMKMVYRTCASLPFTLMPEIPGEKDFNPYYMMFQMDRKAPLYVVNEVLCIVNYQPDGMSAQVFRSYQSSPISYGMLRLEYLKRETAVWFQISTVYPLRFILAFCKIREKLYFITFNISTGNGGSHFAGNYVAFADSYHK